MYSLDGKNCPPLHLKKSNNIALLARYRIGDLTDATLDIGAKAMNGLMMSLYLDCVDNSANMMSVP